MTRKAARPPRQCCLNQRACAPPQSGARPWSQSGRGLRGLVMLLALTVAGVPPLVCAADDLRVAAPFRLVDAFARDWPVLLPALIAMVMMVALIARLAHTNRRLARAKAVLEQRYALILDSVAEGIYGVDRHGRTVFANRALAEMTGWDPADLIGRDQRAVLQATRDADARGSGPTGPLRAALRDGRPHFVDDEVGTRRDGRHFPVEYSVTPIRDRRGATIGSVVVCRDITEQRVAAERICALEREQAHVVRLSTLGEITFGIAHELNQPLTAIATNARACERLIEAGRADLDTCAEVFERIANGADRAGEVIRHIRRFARKEAAQTRPVAVGAILETLAVLLRDEALRNGVRMTCVHGHGVERVLVQQTQIEQVLLNLAFNAIEALEGSGDGGPADPRLHLSARLADGRVWLRVSDNGPGIAAGVRERLFEPFVTDKPQGLGLGLSISADICEAHGGRLSASDSPGGGACFAFSLPCADAGPASPP